MKVGIVGATGLVGQAMLAVLQESSLSVQSIKLFASADSAGKTHIFRTSDLTVEIIKKEALEKGMFILGATSSSIASEWVPLALEAGAVVIDNSSAHRMDPDVPLVVPQVNPESITDKSRLIANPNCSTIQLVMSLKPLMDLARFKWVSVSTYQSVSGAGRKGLSMLEKGELNGPKPGAVHRNILCEIGEPEISGYTEEELKLQRETVKILEADFPVYPACARVPVAVGHTESVTVRMEKPVPATLAAEAMKDFNGLKVVERGFEPLLAQNTDETFVGRIRNHPGDRSILQFWVTADNVRKGAALNAVQILEMMAER
ncbi:aspartate-semialdehyde dehydrogenase [Candidatus Fermentibacteria bacterium]|nr:MAG: aspartate-semialdehyde dehydrogenase [Candidatus Fermentibacteria bacterium]